MTRWSGQSAAMQAIYKEIGRVGFQTTVPVLIRGETGRGQGIDCARHLPAQRPGGRAVHRCQLRRHSRNAAGKRIVRARKSALSPARKTRRIGRFEQAQRGTILLDEIGDMTPGTQVKLVRLLQENCLQRLGVEGEYPTGRSGSRLDPSADLETAIQQKGISGGPLLPAQCGGHRAAALTPTPRGHCRI